MTRKTEKIPYPPHLDLARLPTPVKRLHRIGERFGVELYVKRDDLTGMALSGNKVRKLEFSLADALRKKPIACSPAAVLNPTNCRAHRRCRRQWQVALVGCCSALPTRSSAPVRRAISSWTGWQEPKLSGSPPQEYQHRQGFRSVEAAHLRTRGHIPYIIPKGPRTPSGRGAKIGRQKACPRSSAALPGGAERPPHHPCQRFGRHGRRVVDGGQAHGTQRPAGHFQCLRR